MKLELMKAGYPPIDVKFTDRIAYYNAFDEYHINHSLNAMEKLFAGYVNTRLDSDLAMLEERKYCGGGDIDQPIQICKGGI